MGGLRIYLILLGHFCLDPTAPKRVVWCGPDVFLPAIPPVVVTWTRTADLYRVKFEVQQLKPFACLAFPYLDGAKKPVKGPSFGDELVTSS